jgi:hypothetical protein
MTEPEIICEPMAYVVSLLPLDHIDAELYWLTVEWRDEGQWAVCRPRRCLSYGGAWDWEPNPGERTRKWVASHRFALDVALKLAREAVGKVRVNHTSALEILAECAS